MPGPITNSIFQNEYMIIDVFSNYPKIKDRNLDDCLASLRTFMGSEPTTTLLMFTANLQTKIKIT